MSRLSWWAPSPFGASVPAEWTRQPSQARVGHGTGSTTRLVGHMFDEITMRRGDGGFLFSEDLTEEMAPYSGDGRRSRDS